MSTFTSTTFLFQCGPFSFKRDFTCFIYISCFYSIFPTFFLIKIFFFCFEKIDDNILNSIWRTGREEFWVASLQAEVEVE